jgi:hypothetical protein
MQCTHDIAASVARRTAMSRKARRTAPINTELARLTQTVHCAATTLRMFDEHAHAPTMLHAQAVTSGGQDTMPGKQGEVTSISAALLRRSGKHRMRQQIHAHEALRSTFPMLCGGLVSIRRGYKVTPRA